MPRSPTVYTLPPGTTPQVPDTPISSTMFNAAMNDVEQTFNTIQPQAYGGTGASTAVGAADALSPAFVNVASAATTNIGAASSPNVNITGTAGITAFDTFVAGARRHLVFTGILTITHNATSMILPNNGSNITTAAGDSADAVSLGSGNWKVDNYQRASGTALVPAASLRQRIVNGDKLVSQENVQTSGTTNGRYLSDQNAMLFANTNGIYTGVNVAGRTSPRGGNRDRITITTADTGNLATRSLTYTQNLEGSNIADLKWGASGAIQAVIRRGLRAPAGTWPVAFHNSAANRTFLTTVTVPSGMANQDVTFGGVAGQDVNPLPGIVVPGDILGTWLIADGVIGVTMDFVIGAGSSLQGVAGWQASNVLTVAGATNGMASAGAIFEFFDEGFRLDVAATGVYGSYEVGYTDAIYRSERYYERLSENGFVPLGSGFASATTDARFMWNFLIKKSKVPTVTGSAATSAFGVYFGVGNSQNFEFGASLNPHLNGTFVTVNGGTGLTLGQGILVFFVTGNAGWMAADSRL